MGRIRSIYPDACISQTLADISPREERTFWRLLTYCDDKGRCRADARLIKAAIYPLHDDMLPQEVQKDLDGLSRVGLIQFYTVEGRGYLFVTSWEEFQHPKNPTPSKLPPPGNSFPNPTPELPQDLPTPNPLELGDGDGEGDRTTTTMPTSVGSVAEVANPSPKEKKKPKPRGRDFSIQALAMSSDQQAEFDRLWNCYPKLGWDFRSRKEQPRRINYAEAAKRYKEILDYTDVRRADGSRITPADLSDAMVAWVATRWAEAKRQGLPAPCIPCIGNLLSSVEGEKNHWKEALLTHFDAIPEAS